MAAATLRDTFAPLVRGGNVESVVFMVEELLEEVEDKGKREKEALGFIRGSLWDYRDKKNLFYEIVRALVNDPKLKR